MVMRKQEQQLSLRRKKPLFPGSFGRNISFFDFHNSVIIWISSKNEMCLYTERSTGVGKKQRMQEEVVKSHFPIDSLLKTLASGNNQLVNLLKFAICNLQFEQLIICLRHFSAMLRLVSCGMR